MSEVPASGVHTAPHEEDIQEFSTEKKWSTIDSMSKDKKEVNSGSTAPDQFVRLVYSVKPSTIVVTHTNKQIFV